MLTRQPFLRVNRLSGIGPLIDRTLRQAGIVPGEAMELDSSEAILQMAAAGLGAGVVPAGRMPPTSTLACAPCRSAIRRSNDGSC